MHHDLHDALPGDVLTPHPMTAATPDIIAQRLQQAGLIVLDGVVSRADVLALAMGVMHITAHRDSDPDGLTTIATRSGESRPGFAGFSNAALAPHTERSGVPVSPRLILLVCARQAATGGECLLTDGRQVHADLLHQEHEAVIRLSEPRTAFFSAGDRAGGGHATQVFTPHSTGRVSVRLRLDGLARFSPLVEPYLPALREAAIRHQLSLRLKAGQGYLLDNTRWLHARNSFSGQRLCWRAIGDPKFPLPLGFVPVHFVRATATAGRNTPTES